VSILIYSLTNILFFAILFFEDFEKLYQLNTQYKITIIYKPNIVNTIGKLRGKKLDRKERENATNTLNWLMEASTMGGYILADRMLFSSSFF